MKKNVRRAGVVIAGAVFGVTALGSTAAQAADTSWFSSDTSWSQVKTDTSWSKPARADTSW